jgi:hypothetical protein
MTRNPLYRRGALALTVALTLIAAPAQAADQAKFLPNDTVIYVSVNFKQILESKLIPKDLIAKAKEWVNGQEEIQKYLKPLGLDPFKDIESLTMAQTSITEQEKGFGIITGSFELEKFQKVAEKVAKENEELLKIKKSGTYTVWEITIPNVPNTISAVMVDKHTIIFTPDEDLLKEGLAKADGKKKTELKKEVAAYLKKSDKKTSLSFMLLGSILSKAPFPGQMPDAAKAILDKLEVISGSINVTDDIKLNLSVIAKDTETAGLIGFSAKFGLAQVPNLIDTFAQQFEQIAPFKDVIKDFVKTIKITTKDMTVSATATITKDMIDKVVKELSKKKDD